MKTFLLAVLRHTPWPLRSADAGASDSASLDIVASSVAGALLGIGIALIFLLGSLLLPARVALFIALGLGLIVSFPRATVIRWHQPLKASSALVMGMLTLLKVELVSEIDLEWIPVTLICSITWARAATLSARRDPVVGLPAASGSARLLSLAIGLSPIAYFGVWPQPVWGLWVAAILTLGFAFRLKPRTWAAPMSARYVVLETLFCLCVLALMSAAALTDLPDEDTPGS